MCRQVGTGQRASRIGNSGGKFYSNQLEYAKLVDVTCSDEQTYALASANDWTELVRQGLPQPSSQLALIHTNAADRDGASRRLSP